VASSLIFATFQYCLYWKFGSMRFMHENMNIMQIAFHTLCMKHISYLLNCIRYEHHAKVSMIYSHHRQLACDVNSDSLRQPTLTNIFILPSVSHELKVPRHWYEVNLYTLSEMLSTVNTYCNYYCLFLAVAVAQDVTVLFFKFVCL